MFAARGIILGLAFFALAYVFVSAPVALTSRYVVRKKRSGNFLFGLRILPLVLSLISTFAFMAPSYVLLEPRSGGEGIGGISLALGFFSLLVLAAGGCRGLSLWSGTRRVVSRWREQAATETVSDRGFMRRVRGPAPPLVVAGIRHPEILVSEAAAAVLSRAELETAIRHEMAHARSYDNLKKLIFSFCMFPGMTRLEEAWREAAELAADDAAARNASEALDLASALVKLSRLAPYVTGAELTTALVRNSGESLNARVQRLVERKETRESKAPWARGFVLISALGTIVATVTLYSPALARVHELSEWLVR